MQLVQIPIVLLTSLYSMQKQMRTFKALFAAVFSLSLVFAVSYTSPVLAEEITVVGSGSGARVIELLGAAFSKANPGVTVSAPPSIGSGGGIKAVGTDQATIGRIARALKPNEKEYGISYLALVKLPIVVFVNKSVGIKDLSAQKICDIYSGKITNWKEVGGPDADIRVVRREEGDSSLEVLTNSLPGFKDIKITERSKTTLSDPETIELVQSKENTIAFGTYVNAKGVDVNVLTIDGKSPNDSSYPYVGTLALIFKEKNKAGVLGKFLDYVKSDSAKAIILEAGAFPL